MDSIRTFANRLTRVVGSLAAAGLIAMPASALAAASLQGSTVDFGQNSSWMGDINGDLRINTNNANLYVKVTNASFSGRLEATKDFVANYPIYANGNQIKFGGGATLVDDKGSNLYVTKSNVSFSNSIDVTNNATIRGNLIVSGTVSPEIVSATTFGVTGASTLNGAVTLGDTVADTITVNGNMVFSADSTLDLSAMTSVIIGLVNADIPDALTVDGGTIDNTPIGATTRSSGAFTTLAASGASTLSGVVTASTGLTVTAGGATVTAGGLTVTAGTAALNGGATTTTLTTSGTTTLGDAAGDVITSTGALTASNGLTVTSGGATVTAGGLTVTAGTAALNGGATTTTLTTSGTTTLGDAAGDVITSTGALTASNGLTVTSGGATVTAGGLTVTAGTAALNGGATTTTLAVSGDATVGGSLTITGALSFGALTQVGTANINATGSAATTIAGGSGAVTLGTGTGAVTIGNTSAATNITSSTWSILGGSGTFQTLFASNFLASTGGATISGGGINLNVSSSNATNINTGTSTGAVTIGNNTGNPAVTVNSGTGTIAIGTGAQARTVNVATGAAAQTVTVGSATGTSSLALNSGTGDITATSTDAVTIDAAGVLELNSSAGVIGIGNDAVAQAINVGTGAAARTITVGNSTGATAIALNTGTGALDLGTNAIAHTVTLGNVTGATAVNVNTGTGGSLITTTGIGDFAVASADTLLLDSAGVLELNSSAGAINIGNDAVAQAINVGTGAAARTITVGNGTGATSLVLNAGTGNIDIGANAFARSVNLGTGGAAQVVTVGSTNGTSSLTLASGTGNINIGTGNQVRTIQVGVNTAGNTINIATDNTTADTINLGSALDAVNIAGTMAFTGGMTVSGGAISLNDNSNFATTINGGTSTGTVTVGGGNSTQALNFGNGAGIKTVTVGSTTTTAATTIQSGTGDIALNSQDDLTATMVAGGQIVVDAATTDNTTTTGVIDLDVDAGNAAVDAVNVDLQVADGATAATDFTGLEMLLTADDADADMFGVHITSAATTNAAGGSYEALLRLSNAENTAGAVTDAILITTTSGTAGDIVDAIDASAADITNAINVGANTILGTTGLINYDNFDVDAAGNVIALGGAAISGAATSINASSNFNTNINTGTSTGTITLGGTAAQTIHIGQDNTAGQTIVLGSALDTLTIASTGLTVAATTGATVISGAADGTDALTLTIGDILITNGDFTLGNGSNVGGDFDITLDAGDGASFLSQAAATVDALTVTHSGVGTDGQTIAFTQTDDADATDTTAGLRLTGTSSSGDADAFRAIDIDNLTPGTATEAAIMVGTGWDTILGGTTAGTNIFSFTGYTVAQTTGATVITGTSEDTAALTLTGGDLRVTDGDVRLASGDLLVSAGDFDVTLGAAATAASFTSAATASANPLTVTLTSTNDAADRTALVVNATASDQTARTVRGIAMNMTSAGTAVSDITNGLYLDLASTAGANDIAIKIQNTATWDVDIELQNEESISNAVDGTIALTATTVTASAAMTVTDDLTVSGGDVIGTGGERIDISEATANAFTFTRNDAGAVTLTSADDNADANLTVVAGGTAMLSIGDSGDTLAFTGVDMNFEVIDGQSLDISGDTNPTADLVVIGAGDTSVTDGVDALQLTLIASNASGNIIDLTPSVSNTAAAAENYYGIDIDAFTATMNNAGGSLAVRAVNVGNLTQTETAGTITANALFAGTGWDTILGGTTAVTNLISFTGYTVATTTGATTIAGLADGTAALTLSLGDIRVTDGDLIVSAGDVNFTTDAGDTLNIAKFAAPTQDVVLIASGTSTTDDVDTLRITGGVSSASGSGIFITPAYSDTVAGGTGETYGIIDIDAFTATQNAAGDTGTINALTVGDLTQQETAGTITAVAIDVGAGWDTLFGGTTALTSLFDFTNFDVTTAGRGTFASELDVTGGDISGSNGDSIDIGEATNNAITLIRGDAGEVLLTSADNDATADLKVAAGGASLLTVGDSGDTVALTGADVNAVLLDATMNIDSDGSPLADLLQIGFGDTSVTDNVDALQLTFINSNASGNVIDITSTPSNTAAVVEVNNLININAFTATMNNAGGTLGVNALNIGNLTQTETAGTITGNAISIGTGWDTEITMSGTTPIMSFLNGETFSIKDSDGNNMLQIVDAGAGAGIVGGTFVGVGTTDVTSGTGTNAPLTITADGSGDVVLSVDDATNVQITATAAPLADTVAITNAGFATTTNDADGLSITHAATGATSSSVLDLTSTYAGDGNGEQFSVITLAAASPTNSAGTANYVGLDIGVMTDPGASITSAAIAFSDGWDTEIGMGGVDFTAADIAGNVMFRITDTGSTSTISTDASAELTLGSTSAELSQIFIGDSNGINFGLSQSAQVVYDPSGATDGNRLEISGTNASLWLEDRLALNAQTITIADNAVGASAPTNATAPTASYVEINCQDADGCTYNMPESSANDGDLVFIASVGANAVTVPDQGGIVNGTAPVLGTDDTATFIYSQATSIWQQVATSNN